MGARGNSGPCSHGVSPAESSAASPSSFPAGSQVTDTGRPLHTLPGRSHLSHPVPQAPGSPAGSHVRSHPSFHSPVPGTLLGVKKKKRKEKKWSCKKWKGEALSSVCQRLSKLTLGPWSKLIQSSKTSQRPLRPWTESGTLAPPGTAQSCWTCPFSAVSLLTHCWVKTLSTRMTH